MGWVSASHLKTGTFNLKLTRIAKFVALRFFLLEHHFLRAILDGIAGDA